MRVFVLAGVFACSAAAVAAQTSVPWVHITEGPRGAAVAVERTEPYASSPSVAIPARAIRADVPATATWFRIRAWQEASKSRVIVYAVTEDKAAGRVTEREVQIATYLLEATQSVIVAATEQFGAVPVTLTVRANSQ